MYKLYRIILLIIASLYLQPQDALASHAAAGEIICRWLSDSTYQVTFKFFRDCAGIPAPAQGVSICYQHDGDAYFTNLYSKAIPTLPDGRPNGSPVGVGCPNYPTTCTSPTSTLPGYEEWWYTNTITLPYKADSWKFAAYIAARNFAITNLIVSSIPNLYVEALLNNSDGYNVSTPYFTTRGVPYICVNEPYDYNNGVIDPDGDSLVFSLDTTLDGGSCPATTAPIQFNNTGSTIYNLTDNPLACNNTFKLDIHTGQMSYTPSMQQVAVISLLTKKYRNSVWLATVRRDIQTIVIPCNSPPPVFTFDSTHVTGGENVNGIVTACAGVPLHACFKATNAFPGAQLLVTTNADSAAVGSQVSYTNLRTDSITGCVDWTPQDNQQGLHTVVFTIWDDSCRPPGIIVPRTFSIPIHVYPSLAASKDMNICVLDSAQLHVSGGKRFTWSVLSGDPNSLSCTSCTDPWIKPNTTTSYLVYNEYYKSIICKTFDTVTVKVTYGPSLGADTTILKCKKDAVSLDVQVQGGNNEDYRFRWQNRNYLSNDTSATPYSNTPLPANYTVVVYPRTGLACPSIKTYHVHVSNPPTFIVDSIVCQSASVVYTNTSIGTFTHWLWSFGDRYSDTAIQPMHRYATPGSYITTVVAYPCEDTARQSVTVDSIPYVRFTTDKQSVCEGLAINFYPQYRSGTQSLYWDFGDQTYITGWRPTHSYSTMGQVIIQLTAKNRACPDTTYRDTVQIYPYPLVNIGADTTLCPGQASITLTNLQKSTDVDKYLWSTGATTSSIIVNTDGVYWLQVGADKGCYTTDTIQISKSCYAEIPNAFSPNGDGVNDYFFPRELLSRGVSNFQMQVFNRWGVKIFETNNTDGRGWDGALNGVQQPEGVYVYLIAVSFTNGAQEQYQGNVTLLR